MKRRLGLPLGLLAVLLLVLGTHVSAVPQPGEVHLTAVGDFAQNGNTTAVLDAVKASGSDATLALGDLSYGTAGQEQAWCEYVTGRVGPGYPFELVSGNHESNGLNGNINDFSACLPNQLPGAIGYYGRQYFVDVPAQDPLVRFIMISPSLTFPDGTYNYTAGSPRYAWTAQAIDGARAASIPWVVVGMHKPCITVGKYLCDPGADLFNLLVSKKVDLVLSGHEHNYQRSKQLALSAGCPAVQPGAFNADCVADSDASLVQGAGTVAMVVGTGGNTLYNVNTADAEAGYFASMAGANIDPTYGALDLKATATSLNASFLKAGGGTLADSFSITRNTTNTPPTAAFSSSCSALACSFDGSASSDLDGSIASYAWNFGDGSSDSGATPTHSYATAGSYTATLTVTDDDGGTASVSHGVTVTAPATTTYAADAFGRTVSGGWGSATTGGAWTFTGGSASTLSVNGTGNLTLPAAGKQAVALNSVAAPVAGTDLRLTLTTDKPPTGGGVQFTAFGRRAAGQGGYGARVKLTSAGAVNLELIRESGAGADSSMQPPVATGVTYAVGDKLNVRVQTLGGSPTTVRAKVWKAGTAEPTSWQRSITDATAGLQSGGAVGVSAYISSTASNAPIAVKVDDLIVTAP